MRHIVFSIFLLTLSGYSLTGQNVYDLQAMTDTLQELKKREDLREYSSKQFKILASKIDSIQSSERVLNAKLQNDSYNYEREIAILANSFDNAQRELEALRDSVTELNSNQEYLNSKLIKLQEKVEQRPINFHDIVFKDGFIHENDAYVRIENLYLTEIQQKYGLDNLYGVEMSWIDGYVSSGYSINVDAFVAKNSWVLTHRKCNMINEDGMIPINLNLEGVYAFWGELNADYTVYLKFKIDEVISNMDGLLGYCFVPECFSQLEVVAAEDDSLVAEWFGNVSSESFERIHRYSLGPNDDIYYASQGGNPYSGMFFSIYEEDSIVPCDIDDFLGSYYTHPYDLSSVLQNTSDECHETTHLNHELVLIKGAGIDFPLFFGVYNFCHNESPTELGLFTLKR